MRFCLAYPNQRLSYSETFIQHHKDLLTWESILCHSNHPCLNEKEKPVLSFPFNSLWTRGIARRYFPLFFEQNYTKQLTRFFQKNQTRLVLAEYGPTGANIASACKEANVRLIVHFHGYDATHHETLRRYQAKYQKMFEIASHLVVVSYEMRDKLLQLGANPSKIFYNPYGIDTQKFSGATPDQNPPVLIAVGRFTEKKAPYLTIEAFYKILKEIPEARLKMIGDGGLLEKCKQLATSLGIQSSIDFLGVLDSSTISTHLKKARLFVQHSRYAPDGDSEGTPNTILEASATGLPIVSTRHAGIKEAVIEQKTGFLVEEGDVEGMANHLLTLLQNPILAKEMGLEAQQHIRRNYNLFVNTAKLQDLIDRYE